jgi:hypothetical protein
MRLAQREYAYVAIEREAQAAWQGLQVCYRPVELRASASCSSILMYVWYSGLWLQLAAAHAQARR